MWADAMRRCVDNAECYHPQLLTKYFEPRSLTDTSESHERLPPGCLEDPAGIRDYLYRVGIHVSCDPCWRAGDAAIPDGGHSFHRRRNGALRMDARYWRSLPHLAGVESCISAWGVDVPDRLCLSVLG